MVWKLRRKRKRFRAGPGNFGQSFKHLFRFVMQQQVCLGNNANAPAFIINDGYAPDLVRLHGMHADFYIVIRPAGNGVGGNISLDGCGFGFQSRGDHGAAQVAVRDDADQLPCLVVENNRHRAYIMVAQKFGDLLC